MRLPGLLVVWGLLQERILVKTPPSLKLYTVQPRTLAVKALPILLPYYWQPPSCLIMLSSMKKLLV